MYIKNLILLISLFFIFNCSKNIREIERVWKKFVLMNINILKEVFIIKIV